MSMNTLFKILSIYTAGLVAVVAEDAKSLVTVADKAPQRVWLTAASEKAIEYKVTPESVDLKRLPRAKIDTIYFFEPESFSGAMTSFLNRDYKGAQEQFTGIREAFKKLEEIPGNFSSLAGFYEMECARKLGDYETLETLRGNFLPEKLIREDHRNQYELYAMYKAIQGKSWTRLRRLADELLERDTDWTNSHLAQIYLGKGMALEGEKKTKSALNALNLAFTADFTASEEVVKEAVLACLRIYEADESVKLAKELFGTPDERPGSDGHQLLMEAASLARLWESALGGGEPLPKEYQNFLKYKPTVEAAVVSSKEEKPEEEKPEEE